MFTDPKQGLGFSIGIMLIVNSDFTLVFAQASDELKASIAQILEKGPRVAIWNIASPVANGYDGDGRLCSDCLKIFKACDVSSKLASQAR
jgi:hypothetical protein